MKLNFAQPTSVATRTKRVIHQGAAPQPERNTETARLAFVARRGVPLARAGVIAEIVFSTGATR